MSESLKQIYEHMLAKGHSLKQDAARELTSLEGAEQRIVFLKEHIANLDAQLVNLARNVKDTGLYFLHWTGVPTMPAAAQELLTANVAPDPVADDVAEAK